MSVTVDTIRTKARQRADMENSSFVSDTEWISYINAGYKELYDMLVSKFEDYYTIQATFTIPNGSISYALPAGFYKLRGVDRSKGGGEYYSLLPFSFERRNARGFYQRFYRLQPDIRYRLMANTLIFSPEDQAPGDYRFWYVPVASDLTLSTDVVDGVNGYEQYIELSAAIQALIKEESDPQALMAERNMVIKRIDEMAANRDMGEVETVNDVTGANASYFDGFYP